MIINLSDHRKAKASERQLADSSKNNQATFSKADFDKSKAKVAEAAERLGGGNTGLIALAKQKGP